MRIKNFLGVNLNGASIIVNLMERIEELEEELDRIEKKR
jgi:MerR family transcriptional regulator/heat shock protein HspR